MLRGVVSLSETPSQEKEQEKEQEKGNEKEHEKEQEKGNEKEHEKGNEKEQEKGNEEKHERETTPSIMILDAVTLKNLDILPDPTNPSLHSLFAYIDHTVTACGKRLLTSWLCQPLYNINEINEYAHALLSTLDVSTPSPNSSRTHRSSPPSRCPSRACWTSSACSRACTTTAAP